MLTASRGLEAQFLSEDSLSPDLRGGPLCLTPAKLQHPRNAVLLRRLATTKWLDPFVKLRTSSKSFSSGTQTVSLTNHTRSKPVMALFWETSHKTDGDSSQRCQHLAVLHLQGVKSPNEPGSSATIKVPECAHPVSPIWVGSSTNSPRKC